MEKKQPDKNSWQLSGPPLSEQDWASLPWPLPQFVTLQRSRDLHDMSQSASTESTPLPSAKGKASLEPE